MNSTPQPIPPFSSLGGTEQDVGPRQGSALQDTLKFLTRVRALFQGPMVLTGVQFAAFGKSPWKPV